MTIVDVVIIVLMLALVLAAIVESAVLARSEYRMNRELRERMERMTDDTRD